MSTRKTTNNIDRVFKKLKDEKRKGFIAYITAGDPSLELTSQLIDELGNSGVDVIELGVPFSDPLADGTVNQESAQRALAQKVTLKKIFAELTKHKNGKRPPIVLFTYYNPVLQYGLERFVEDCRTAGIDGALVLDLPPEEAEEYKGAMENSGLKTVFLVAPTSTGERIQLICRHSTGFLYYVSRTGVTGIRDSVEKSVRPMVKSIRKYTRLPVAVGFGIATPQQVREVSTYADAVVVGSAIVKKIEENSGSPEMVKIIGRFVRELTTCQ